VRDRLPSVHVGLGAPNAPRPTAPSRTTTGLDDDFMKQDQVGRAAAAATV
jgi:hypothetical protein